MAEDLVKELTEIGLAEKEARVYLASLELGPATAQSIAVKATLPRPTTYIMIESLIKRGLMSSFQKGKKRYFSAESPELLTDLFEDQFISLKRKRENFLGLVPRMLSLVRLSDMPSVKMLEGIKSLQYIQNDLLAAKTPVDNIVSVDEARMLTPESDLGEYWQQLKKNGILIRTLYSKEVGDESFGKSMGCNWEARKLPKELFEFKGEITIYDDKVAALIIGGQSVGILIESVEIASTMRTLFNLAWDASEKYQV